MSHIDDADGAADAVEQSEETVVWNRPRRNAMIILAMVAAFVEVVLLSELMFYEACVFAPWAAVLVTCIAKGVRLSRRRFTLITAAALLCLGAIYVAALRKVRIANRSDVPIACFSFRAYLGQEFQYSHELSWSARSLHPGQTLRGSFRDLFESDSWLIRGELPDGRRLDLRGEMSRVPALFGGCTEIVIKEGDVQAAVHPDEPRDEP